jgi:D-xylulose reductase
MVLGHESSGMVEAVGSGVTTLSPGDRVAMEPGIPCRRCERCLGGRYNLCAAIRFAATPPYDGTLARYYVLPEDFCYKLPEHVSLEEGALTEPMAVAVHVVRQAAVRPGDTVVVMGAGPVGLLCAAVARAFGAKKIVSVDVVKERLEFAKRFAADGVFLPEKVEAEKNAERLVKEHELGDGADVVIDASGAEPSIQASVHMLRTGGTYVQGGMGKPDVTFPILAFCAKEVTMKGSFRYGSGDYKLAVDLIASGQVKVKEMITGKVSFEEAEKALLEVKAGRGIKTLIEGIKD